MHPGAPLVIAEMAVALWNGHLSHNPANPTWPDRNRSITYSGHTSMRLYGLLHLSSYNLPRIARSKWVLGADKSNAAIRAWV